MAAKLAAATPGDRSMFILKSVQAKLRDWYNEYLIARCSLNQYVSMFFISAPHSKRKLDEKFANASTLSPSRSIDSQLHNLSAMGMSTPVSENNM